MTKRRRIIEVAPASVVKLDCRRDCNGACCRKSTTIPLNRAEKGQDLLSMQTKTTLEPSDVDRVIPAISDADDPSILEAGVGIYVLVRDCGHLSLEGSCNIHTEVSPARPSACARFAVGSVPCLIERARAGYQDELPAHLARIVHEGVAAG